MALVTFTAGERLFAAELNDNFQETRTAANIITGTFNAGRIPNLDASKITAGTIAAALLPAGNVLQVSNGRFTAQQDIATPTFTATAITASITPQFTGSKILVMAYVSVRGNTGGANDVATDTRLLRGGTVIAETREHHRPGTGNFAMGYHVLAVLDSPATGSPVTYSVQARISSAADGRNMSINREGGSSSLLLMEVR